MRLDSTGRSRYGPTYSQQCAHFKGHSEIRPQTPQEKLKISRETTECCCSMVESKPNGLFPESGARLSVLRAPWVGKRESNDNGIAKSAKIGSEASPERSDLKLQIGSEWFNQSPAKK